jgi:hypothetical protein
MLIILAESRSLRRKLVHHPADAGSIHLGNVGGIWPLSFVAFLRADSNSCAVFAAATIEFIGVFNV